MSWANTILVVSRQLLAARWSWIFGKTFDPFVNEEILEGEIRFVASIGFGVDAVIWFGLIRLMPVDKPASTRRRSQGDQRLQNVVMVLCPYASMPFGYIALLSRVFGPTVLDVGPELTLA